MQKRFFFQLIVSIMIMSLAALSHRAETAEFFHNWFLWFTPVIAGMIAGALASLVGLYLFFNRMIFLSLAVTQAAGLGIFISFWAGSFWGLELENSPWALLAGVAAALISVFLLVSRSKKVGPEVVMGLTYAASSGLILILGDRISEGRHTIDNLLFGSAVAVSSQDLILLMTVTCVLSVMHFLFRRVFLFVSADPIFMQVNGVSVRFWKGLLYVTLAFGIVLCLKTLGAVPAFALMVIPPFVGLHHADGVGRAFRKSFLTGTLMPFLGYYFSYIYSFPTGASVVGAGLIFMAGSLFGWKKPVK